MLTRQDRQVHVKIFLGNSSWWKTVWDAHNNFEYVLFWIQKTITKGKAADVSTIVQKSDLEDIYVDWWGEAVCTPLSKWLVAESIFCKTAMKFFETMMQILWEAIVDRQIPKRKDDFKNSIVYINQEWQFLFVFVVTDKFIFQQSVQKVGLNWWKSIIISRY